MRSVEGAALPGAWVCIEAEASLDAPEVACAESDSEGFFSLSAGTSESAMLVVSATGFVSQRRLSSRADLGRRMVFELLRGGVAVAGQVLDALGGALPGAKVRARLPGTERTVGLVMSAEDGSFSLPSPEGLIELDAQAPGYSRVVRSEAAPGEGIVLALVPAAAVFGRVLAGEEAPLAALARVRLRSVDNSLLSVHRETSTDQQGHFHLGGLRSGRYELAAVGPSFRGAPVALLLSVGEEQGPVEIHAAPATTLSGQVTVAGKVCGGGYARVRGPVAEIEPISPDGRVVFEGLLAGRYFVSITCAEDALQERRSLIAAEGVVADPRAVGGEDWVDLSLEPVHRTWDLLPLDSAPTPTAAGALVVSLDGPGADQPYTVVARDPEGQLRVARFEGGRYRFDGLTLGQYVVYLRRFPQLQAPVQLRAGDEMASLTLSLPAHATISGRLVDAEGTSLPDAWVTATTPESVFGAYAPVGEPALTNARGEYVIETLATGAHRLVAECAEGEAVAQALAGSRDVELSIRRYARLSGIVLGLDGSPAKDSVLTYGSASTDSTSVDVPFGAWSLPRVAPGDYLLIATSGLARTSTRVRVEPGGAAWKTLELRAAPTP